MNSVLEIARLTFKEAIRNKITYGMLAFVIILMLAAAALASVTMGRTALMIVDLGLGAISIMANLMAVVFTIQTLQQEKENRTLYVLLTRLHQRWQYVAGKYFGLAAVLGLQVLCMCLILSGFVAFFGQIEWVSFIQACFIMLLEIWIIIAIAIIFAQSSSLFLALLLTVCVDIAGRFTSVIHHLGTQSDSSLLQGISDAMYYILPNLEKVNLRNGAGYIPYYPWAQTGMVTIYGISEILLLIGIASWIFSRRNLS